MRMPGAQFIGQQCGVHAGHRLGWAVAVLMVMDTCACWQFMRPAKKHQRDARGALACGGLSSDWLHGRSPRVPNPLLPVPVVSVWGRKLLCPLCAAGPLLLPPSSSRSPAVQDGRGARPASRRAPTKALGGVAACCLQGRA